MFPVYNPKDMNYEQTVDYEQRLTPRPVYFGCTSAPLTLTTS